MNGARCNDANLYGRLKWSKQVRPAYVWYKICKPRYSIHLRSWWSRRPLSDAHVIFVASFNVWSSKIEADVVFTGQKNTVRKNPNWGPIYTDRVHSAMWSTITWYKPTGGWITSVQCTVQWTRKMLWTKHDDKKFLCKKLFSRCEA